jgi:hybrid polyketide synthase/nonribosomal peptide synthetase ACE1
MRDLHRAFSEGGELSISKELPTYVWDHDRVVWGETRVSKAHRLRSTAKHELLGVREVDEGEGERRWRNYLKPKEMPWLRGHRIQGEMVFPAAGYAVMALEAIRTLASAKGAAPNTTIRLMQLQKFSIHKAISFMDDNTGIETLFCLSGIQQSRPDAEGQSQVSAEFDCYACLNKEVGDFTSMASGHVTMSIGQGPDDDASGTSMLPERPRWVNNFVNTDVAYFYECLGELGYGYQGMFQGVTDLRRTNGGSKGTITIPQDDGEDESMPQNWVVHPATLDVAFQAVFAAIGAPGDGRLWTLHVPTMIDSIAINPGADEMQMSGGVATPLPFDAFVVNTDQEDGIAGDVDLYDEDGQRVIMQIQGLHVTPLTKASAADDRETFASISWDLSTPDLVRGWSGWQQEEADQQLARFGERLSLCILRDLCDAVAASGADVESTGTAHQRSLLEWAQHVVAATRAREHPTCAKEWLADSWELLQVHAQRLAKTNVQVRHCLAIREYLTPFMLGQLSPEQEVEFGRLSDGYYATIPGYRVYLDRLAGLTKQLAFKHRNMRVLEIGAGKGHCTKAILDVLGQNFSSYTCTDADAACFELIRAQIPAAQAERVHYKVLDLENSPADQDFVAGHYDLVVASNALHAAAELDETLKQIRTLVRPGGYLALLEPTSSSSLAIALGGCVFPAWFGGVEEDRRYSPFATHEKWDQVLQVSGFSGLDTATPEEQALAVPYSVMCSMAVDQQMKMLRDPLSHSGQTTPDANLLIIGGRTVHTRNLVRDLKRTLGPFSTISCRPRRSSTSTTRPWPPSRRPSAWPSWTSCCSSPSPRTSTGPSSRSATACRRCSG